ncbi:hypothetical protein GCM10020256_52030 [Streptomyces thermocoprophilus]
MAVVRAVTTWLSEKCAVRRDAGSGMPSAPMRNWAAGLCAYSCSGSPVPGTFPSGASGITVTRRGSTGCRAAGEEYGCRTPM